MPPKPPPISSGVNLTMDSGTPRMAAVQSRTSKGACVLFQMYTRPSLPQFTVQTWGSMYP